MQYVVNPTYFFVLATVKELASDRHCQNQTADIDIYLGTLTSTIFYVLRSKLSSTQRC